jgi:hypothetical protein
VLTGDHPKVGDVIEAWLVVPKYAGAPANSSASLTLLPPSTAVVWLRQPATGCAASEDAHQMGLSGAVPRDTILFACVRPTDKGVLRLVAVRRATDATGATTVQRIGVSDPLSVDPWFTLSPTLAAALSAIGGFPAGFLGHIITQWWDNRQADKRSVKEMQAVALKALIPELTENQKKLEEFLAGAIPAPGLHVVGYNEVLGDKGVAAFLGEGTRAKQYASLHAVYKLIKVYTTTKNTPHTPVEKIEAAARNALDAIREPLAHTT